MWRRKTPEPKSDDSPPGPLRQALRQARIESAERTGTVVDLRDAELARLELLNDALDPLYAEIPSDLDLFDRGVSRGDPPRLWIDPIAHVHMGRDKRTYRLVQDTRYGRTVIAESTEVADLAEAVTAYVARRMLERERALAADPSPAAADRTGAVRPRRRWPMIGAFALGVVVGIVTLFATAWWLP